MIETITKSKTRKKILQLFFENIGKEFYLSEIAKKINSSAGTTQRELNVLIDQEIVLSRKYANLHYYSLNRRHPSFEDFKNIIIKTIGIEFELKKVIKNNKEIQHAFIFGSYVKGDFNFKSDLDLLIIGSPDENKLIKDIVSLEKKINREINYHIYYPEEFKKHIKSDSFLQGVVKNMIFLTNTKNEFRKLL